MQIRSGCSTIAARKGFCDCMLLYQALLHKQSGLQELKPPWNPPLPNNPSPLHEHLDSLPCPVAICTVKTVSSLHKFWKCRGVRLFIWPALSATSAK